MDTAHKIRSAAITAAIRIAKAAPHEQADLELASRLRGARTALIEANARNDFFAAACAVEQMERAVEYRAT
ncbi:MAG TPA: hypothetical protein PK620_15345 [Denitromonas sp.]|nr:hypothetical protein [Rhodocyclaceae bacterium]HQV16287.1 hypothetical protein [Denitromonas sp.]